MSARTEEDKLLWRLRVAMDQARAIDLTLDELCRIVPIIEGAAERQAGRADNVITFAACRRRKARRTGSRSQSARRRVEKGE